MRETIATNAYKNCILSYEAASGLAIEIHGLPA